MLISYMIVKNPEYLKVVFPSEDDNQEYIEKLFNYYC